MKFNRKYVRIVVGTKSGYIREKELVCGARSDAPTVQEYWGYIKERGYIIFDKVLIPVDNVDWLIVEYIENTV